MAKKLSDDDIKKFLDSEEKEAVGYAWGDLARQREVAMKYYMAEPFGNEPSRDENRSSVVTTDVSDSVEWILPSLIRVFAATDKAVEFEAQSVEDEAGAKQATATCNYVFWRQNPGFLIMYSWFKDSLIQKNGAVKWWWEKSVQKKKEKYHGKTLDELTMMLSDVDKIEIISQTAYDDPQQPGSMLYDVEIEVTDETGKCCIEPIPPEELLVSKRHNSILLDNCPYVSHISKKTLSELRDMGYEFDDDDVVGDSASFIEDSPERQARELKNEGGVVDSLRTDTTDPSQKEVWLREAYVLLDEDGDGIAERRRIVRAGNKILEDELCDSIQIAAITPIIMTHRFYGMSVAELVMDLQLLKSTLWRQMIDNLFAANNQGHIVLSSSDGRVQANIDDLLTSRPNRVIREYTPNAVRPDVTPWVASQTFPMLEYIDQQRMNRTGSNSLSSGLDADSINKTARGATMAQNQMQEKIELIARIFAETGVKAMFRGIQNMLSKYSQKTLTYKLLNEYVTVDPREWKTGYDMTINVGLGTGNKDQQLIHLQAISQAQAQAVQMGGMGLLVTPKNIFNTQARIAENAGFKNVAEFWTDPKDQMPQPPQQPPPDPIKMRELDIKEREQGTHQFSAETERQKAQSEQELKAAGHTLDQGKADADVKLTAAGMLNETEQWEKDRQLDAQKTILANTNEQEDDDMKDEDDGPSHEQQILAQIAHGQLQLGQQIKALVEHMSKPKPRMRRVPKRDPQTQRIIQVDEVPIED